VEDWYGHKKNGLLLVEDLKKIEISCSLALYRWVLCCSKYRAILFVEF